MLYKGISILNKVSYITDRNAISILHSTLVLPYMMCACVIWGTTYNSSVERVIRLQNDSNKNCMYCWIYPASKISGAHVVFAWAV